MTQKPEDLVYTMAEAWNLVLTSTFVLKLQFDDGGG